MFNKLGWSTLQASSRRVGGDIPTDPWKVRITLTNDTVVDVPLNGSTIVTPAEVVTASVNMNLIKGVIVGEGMTELADYCFARGWDDSANSCVNATIGPKLPSTLETIQYRSFIYYGKDSAGCTSYDFHQDSIITVPASDTFRLNTSMDGTEMFLPPNVINAITAFYDLDSFSGNITIGDRVDGIPTYVFGSCGTFTITFEQNTVPTGVVETAGNNGWICRGTSVKLYVPATGDSLSTWKAKLWSAGMDAPGITHINDVLIGDIP